MSKCRRWVTLSIAKKTSLLLKQKTGKVANNQRNAQFLLSHTYMNTVKSFLFLIPFIICFWLVYFRGTQKPWACLVHLNRPVLHNHKIYDCITFLCLIGKKTNNILGWNVPPTGKSMCFFAQDLETVEPQMLNQSTHEISSSGPYLFYFF